MHSMCYPYRAILALFCGRALCTCRTRYIWQPVPRFSSPEAYGSPVPGRLRCRLRSQYIVPDEYKLSSCPPMQLLQRSTFFSHSSENGCRASLNSASAASRPSYRTFLLSAPGVVTITFSGVIINAPFAVAAPLNIFSTTALNASTTSPSVT